MNPRHRLLALVAVAGLAWVARERLAGPDELLARPGTARSGTRTAAPVRGAGARALPSPTDELCSVPVPPPRRGAFGAVPQADPFTGLPRPAAVRTVALAPAPPPPAPPPAPVVSAPPPPPPAPPPAPRLALRYLGHVDPQGGEGASVFLTNGQQVLVARAGDTVDGGFRLERVGPRELVFVHVQQNHTVRLPVGGETP